MIEKIQAGLLVLVFFSLTAGVVVGINQQNALLAKKAFVLGEETACQTQGTACNDENPCCQGLICRKQKRSLMARIFSRKSKGRCVPERRERPKPSPRLEDKSQGVSKRAHCKNLLRLKEQLSSVIKELDEECKNVDFETDETPPRSIQRKLTGPPINSQSGETATEASRVEN